MVCFHAPRSDAKLELQNQQQMSVGCLLKRWNHPLFSGWWFQIFVYFHPYLGKWSNLTNIFQMGWNHQLVLAQWSSPRNPGVTRRDQRFTWMEYIWSGSPFLFLKHVGFSRVCQKKGTQRIQYKPRQNTTYISKSLLNLGNLVKSLTSRWKSPKDLCKNNNTATTSPTPTDLSPVDPLITDPIPRFTRLNIRVGKITKADHRKSLNLNGWMWWMLGSVNVEKFTLHQKFERNIHIEKGGVNTLLGSKNIDSAYEIWRFWQHLTTTFGCQQHLGVLSGT